MSRSGYGDDLDNWELIKWRGMVASATRGKRGQKLLREMAEAMDAMPKKELIVGALESDGEHCALGVVGAKRSVDMSSINPEDFERVGETFDIAQCLAQEIAYVNDEGNMNPENPTERWKRVRAWVAEQMGRS